MPVEQSLAVRAEQGDPEAQYDLGLRYARAETVPQSISEAAKWFQRAAEQGYGKAQHRLGMMYAGGEGVPEDLVLAHMWLNLAVSRLAGDDQRSAVNNRYLIGQRMSRGQLEEAERLAFEWKPTTE
jgi:TPR repeat protein